MIVLIRAIENIIRKKSIFTFALLSKVRHSAHKFCSFLPLRIPVIYKNMLLLYALIENDKIVFLK